MNYTGKKVIIRSYGAGVFFGTLKEKVSDKGGVEVTLTDCRRLWYWSGAASLSQLATEGVKNPNNCKFTVTVSEMTIMQVIEVLPCTEDAIVSITGVKVWKI